MALFLGILLFSFFFTAVAIVPFIDLLYRSKFIRPNAQLVISGGGYLKKIGKPTGAGVLIIFLVSLLFAVIFPFLHRMGVYVTSSFPIHEQLNVIFLTFISFGVLGLYDDIHKVFNFKNTGFSQHRAKYKYIIQAILSLIISLLLYFNLHISIINLPFVGVLNLGWWYVPLSAMIIMAFTNAYNLSDGADGLAGGLLLICLLAFWGLSVSYLDTPLSVFIALWIGSLIAFLYFNVYPSRIWLGNTGSFAFGATLAVVGLLLGKTVAILIIGGVFMAILMGNLLQVGWTKFTGKKLFPITPLHHWLQVIGWSESKIVMRAWMAGIILAFFGLWLAQL